ncbi:MAG: hypothetical protein QGI09_07385, partial [Dehalococcoidia bacterium]|nr:hypothetical protein [Dehalococcoidia bacterium]
VGPHTSDRGGRGERVELLTEPFPTVLVRLTSTWADIDHSLKGVASGRPERCRSLQAAVQEDCGEKRDDLTHRQLR